MRALAVVLVVLSPGPGDPMLLDHVVTTARGLTGKVPLMGICLGHQVLGRVFGAETYKLKFGHRGANHPVRDETTGRVYITAQNHGYAVDDDRFPDSGALHRDRLALHHKRCGPLTRSLRHYDDIAVTG